MRSQNPYFQNSTEQLSAIVQNHSGDLEILGYVLDELKHRVSPEALQLFIIVDNLIKTLKSELSQRWNMSRMRRYLEIPLIASWFNSKAASIDILAARNVSVWGYGSVMNDQELRDRLRILNVSVIKASAATDLLIIGESGWRKSSLERLLSKRDSLSLRIYSQEMFIAWVMTRKDPLDNYDVAVSFASYHPALQYLSNLGFQWPTTDVVMGTGPFINTPWPQTGMLKAFGYKVGSQGLNQLERRDTLQKIFDARRLPKLISQEYVDSWGEARTCGRLGKIANSIAAFTRNAKRNQTKNMTVHLDLAIKNWESDLAWLYKEFYVHSHCRFSWPITDL